MSEIRQIEVAGVMFTVDLQWPLTQRTRENLAFAHEPKASNSPDGFRLATCVVCERPMVAMWHLWLAREVKYFPSQERVRIIKEIHMCHACATDIFGAPEPDRIVTCRCYGVEKQTTPAECWCAQNPPVVTDTRCCS